MHQAFASTLAENNLADKLQAQTIAGLDEVGRGALAGPLVVGCFMRNASQHMPEVKDSKLLSAKQRRALLPQIFGCAKFWSIGIVEARDISQRGMTWALHEAYNQALSVLPEQPELVLYDGHPLLLDHTSAHAIVHGDQTHATIAAASIIAKVVRDLFMDGIAEDYPQYFFHKHKGYGTKKHKHALLTQGPIKDIHRTEFVKTFLSP